MIFHVAKELTAILKSRGCPYAVEVDDAPVTQTTFARSRIFLRHTKGEGADRFGAPRSQRPRDKHRFTRTQGWTCEIVMKSPKGSAQNFEHEILAEEVLDQLIIAFDDVASRRKNAWAPIAGGFDDFPDFEGSERPGGVRYVLLLTFDRAVIERDFDGGLEPTATLPAGGLTSTTKVSLSSDSTDTSQPPPGAATGCGG